MDDRIFTPLGMARTTLRPVLAMTWPLAQGHDVIRGKAAVLRPAADNAANWPAGSVFSSVLDLARFVIAFMNDGRLEGRNVLPPKLIATMTAPHADIPGTDSKYGYGLQLSEHRGMRSVEHGGSRAGYGSLIRMLPAQRVAVIILANRSGANLPAIADALIGSLVKLAPEPPRPAAHAIQASVAARYAGTYRNGDSKLSLYVRDGGLYMKTGGRELMLEPVDATHLTAGNMTLAFIAGADGAIEYLHAGGRSYVRTPE